MPIAECQVCHRGFYVKPSQQKLGGGKYCSTICRSKAQLNGKYFACLVCHQPVYRSLRQIKHSKSGNFFCSKSCQTKWRNSFYIAQLHPNWTTGINAYRKILIRNGQRPICANCGIEDKRILSVHHLDHDRKNNSIKNLVWLCFNCHFLVHHDHNFELNLKRKIAF